MDPENCPKLDGSMCVMTSCCLFLSFLLPFFSPLVVQASSKSFFIASWNLLASILSSQDDLRNLKNLDFRLDIHRFLRIRAFRYEDGLENVLELSWAPLGCSWGSLGGLLGSSGVLWGVFWGLLSSLGVVFGALRSLLGAIFTLLRTILNSTTGFSSPASWRASIPLGARRVSRSAGLNNPPSPLRRAEPSGLIQF